MRCFAFAKQIIADASNVVRNHLNIFKPYFDANITISRYNQFRFCLKTAVVMDRNQFKLVLCAVTRLCCCVPIFVGIW